MVKACCCIKPKTAAVLVALLDIAIGLAALGGTGYLLYEIFGTDAGKNPNPEKEPNLNSLNEFVHWFHSNILNWQVAVAYLAPALTTFVLGILIMASVCKTDSILGTLSLFLNLLLIIGSIADICVMIFVVGTHWAILIPVALLALIQVHFTWALQNFRSNDLKTEVDE